MNRRDLFKGAAGLVLAAGAGELLVPERKIWALGRWAEPAVPNEPIVLVRPDGLAYIPEKWRGHRVIVDSLVAPGHIYIYVTSDPRLQELLEFDREWIRKARELEGRA